MYRQAFVSCIQKSLKEHPIDMHLWFTSEDGVCSETQIFSHKNITPVHTLIHTCVCVGRDVHVFGAQCDYICVLSLFLVDLALAHDT